MSRSGAVFLFSDTFGHFRTSPALHISRTALEAGATYRATVRGKVDGKPFEYGWSFTTA